MERKEFIYLDSNGNKTDKEHAVEVVIRIYSESGDLIGRRIEPVENGSPKNDQGRFGEDLATNIPESQKPKAPQISETWVCPNDETVNTGDRCIICGIPRPEKEKKENVISSVGQNVTSKSKAKKKLLPIVAALVLMAVVCSGFLYWYTTMLPEARFAADYAKAEALLQSEDYDQAIAAFESLGEYSDSADRILEVRYDQASRWLASGKYDKAIVAFEALNGYKDSAAQIAKARQGQKYTAAEELEKSGRTAEAAIAFSRLGDKKRSFSLWNTLAIHPTISAGGGHAVGLKADGTVVAVGLNTTGQCNISSWKNIIALSASKAGSHTVGLRNNGTVVAVGDNKYGQCNVGSWTDIVAVSAGCSHTVGLKADGTVVSTGDNKYGQCNVGGWTDIVDVSAGTIHTIGLKSDGTVVAVGDNECGQCDVSKWRNIVAISAGDCHTIGLKADGSVVATGNNQFGQCDVIGWMDIVAISAGVFHTVGLKSDGTVLATDTSYDMGQCNVGNWREIVAISAGFTHTVGLKSDGSVVAVGENEYDKCNVNSWKNIKVPLNR